MCLAIVALIRCSSDLTTPSNVTKAGSGIVTRRAAFRRSSHVRYSASLTAYFSSWSLTASAAL